jgi:hypothetical protein
MEISLFHLFATIVGKGRPAIFSNLVRFYVIVVTHTDKRICRRLIVISNKSKRNDRLRHIIIKTCRSFNIYLFSGNEFFRPLSVIMRHIWLWFRQVLLIHYRKTIQLYVMELHELKLITIENRKQRLLVPNLKKHIHQTGESCKASKEY